MVLGVESHAVRYTQHVPGYTCLLIHNGDSKDTLVPIYSSTTLVVNGSMAYIADQRAHIRRQLWQDIDSRALCLAQGDVISAKVYTNIIASRHETLRQLCCEELAYFQSETDCCSMFKLYTTLNLQPHLGMRRLPAR